MNQARAFRVRTAGALLALPPLAFADGLGGLQAMPAIGLFLLGVIVVSIVAGKLWDRVMGKIGDAIRGAMPGDDDPRTS